MKIRFVVMTAAFIGFRMFNVIIILFVFYNYSTKSDNDEKGPNGSQNPTAHFGRNARLEHFGKDKTDAPPLERVWWRREKVREEEEEEEEEGEEEGEGGRGRRRKRRRTRKRKKEKKEEGEKEEVVVEEGGKKGKSKKKKRAE